MAHLAKQGLAYSRLRQACFTIARAHIAVAAGRLDRADTIGLLMHGIGRTIRTRAQGATPLRAAELTRMARTLTSSWLIAAARVSRRGFFTRAELDDALVFLQDGESVPSDMRVVEIVMESKRAAQ